MKNITIFCLVSLVCILTLAQKPAVSERTLIIDGEAQAEYIPDITILSLEFSIEEYSQKKALDSLNVLISEAIDVLNEVPFLSKEDLLTNSFQSRQNVNREGELMYWAMQRMTMKFFTESERIILLMNLLMENDIRASYDLQWEFSEKFTKDVIEEELTKKAFESASRKAKILAEAGKFKIGEIQSVNSSDRFQNSYFFDDVILQQDVGLFSLNKQMRTFGGFNIESKTVSKKLTIEYIISK